MFRFLFIIPLLVLGGCGYLTPATTAISTGVEKYCAAPIERATLRAGLSPEAFPRIGLSVYDARARKLSRAVSEIRKVSLPNSLTPRETSFGGLRAPVFYVEQHGQSSQGVFDMAEPGFMVIFSRIFPRP